MPQLNTEQELTKSSINRIGTKFKENKLNFAIVNDVQQYREFRMQCFKTSLGILYNSELPNDIITAARLKRLDSIHRKLSSKKFNFRLGELDDILGFRVICATYNDQQEIVNLIKNNNPDQYINTKDYTENNNYTDYRAIHVIMGFKQEANGKLIKVKYEIQIRTVYQNYWANYSESFGENVKKGGSLNPTAKETQIINELKKERNVIKEWEEKNPDKNQFRSIEQNRLNIPTYSTVWMQERGMPKIDIFNTNATAAINKLFYYENNFPHIRQNALLLIGIINPEEILKTLRLSHPNYSKGRSIKPSVLMTN